MDQTKGFVTMNRELDRVLTTYRESIRVANAREDSQDCNRAYLYSQPDRDRAEQTRALALDRLEAILVTGLRVTVQEVGPSRPAAPREIELGSGNGFYTFHRQASVKEGQGFYSREGLLMINRSIDAKTFHYNAAMKRLKA